MEIALKDLYDLVKLRLNKKLEEEINTSITVDYFFPTLFFVPNLKEITFEKMLIDSEMEDALGCFSDLVKLHLNHCGLSKFPSDIYNFSKLKDLSLAGNDFIGVPVNLFNLPSLQNFFIKNPFKMNFKNEH